MPIGWLLQLTLRLDMLIQPPFTHRKGDLVEMWFLLDWSSSMGSCVPQEVIAHSTLHVGQSSSQTYEFLNFTFP